MASVNRLSILHLLFHSPFHRTLLRCRLCWFVAVVVFASILAVEAVILVPSYLNYEQQQERERIQLANQVAVAILNPLTDKHDYAQILMAGHRAVNTQLLLGGAIYDMDEQLLGTFGQAPQLLLEQSKRQALNAQRDSQALDVVVDAILNHSNYYLIVRVNAADIPTKLSAYVWRILGLIALIASAVTLTTMFVLGVKILYPILKLKERLVAVGNDPKHPEKYELGHQRRDELGEMITAFNTMLRFNAGYLQELHKTKEILEQRVKQRTAELEFRTTHDALTQLPNRSLLLDRLSHAIASARSYQVAVLFINLDRFNRVNDEIGHNAGDQILKIIARRLQSCLRNGDTVARVGGDEFVIVLENLQHEKTAAMMVSRLLQVTQTPIALHNHDFVMTSSIGLSLFPKDGKQAETLLKNASIAMYRAKEQGRNNVQFYAQEMNAQVQQRLLLERHLRVALEKNELELHYQPQIDGKNRHITGVETLLRWRHPELGYVAPSTFIPLAEETGLINSIGEWVLTTACRQAKDWQLAQLPQLRVAVNISACQFRQQDVAALVSSSLEKSGLPARYLELEITESAVVQNIEDTLQTLRALKKMGVRLAIDDFGTGYSSLGYLKSFPIDHLKIDRMFVHDITIDPDSTAIALAIIAMAHSLRLKVIAEGVETDEQQQFLEHHRCDELQGFHISRPLTAEAMTKLLRQRSLTLIKQQSA